MKKYIVVVMLMAFALQGVAQTQDKSQESAQAQWLEKRTDDMKKRYDAMEKQFNQMVKGGQMTKDQAERGLEKIRQRMLEHQGKAAAVPPDWAVAYLKGAEAVLQAAVKSGDLDQDRAARILSEMRANDTPKFEAPKRRVLDEAQIAMKAQLEKVQKEVSKAYKEGSITADVGRKKVEDVEKTILQRMENLGKKAAQEKLKK